jgi:hypothetical protein
VFAAASGAREIPFPTARAAYNRDVPVAKQRRIAQELVIYAWAATNPHTYPALVAAPGKNELPGR